MQLPEDRMLTSPKLLCNVRQSILYTGAMKRLWMPLATGT